MAKKKKNSCKLVFKYWTKSGGEKQISASTFAKKVKAARKKNPNFPTVEEFKSTACRQGFWLWGVCKPGWLSKKCPDNSPNISAEVKGKY